MKKIKLTKIMLFILTLGLIMGVNRVSAASSYYDNIWITEWAEESTSTLYGINDIVETSSGYLAVGFTGESNDDDYDSIYVTILTLDSSGNVKSVIQLPEYDFVAKKIVEYNGYYYVIGDEESTTYTADGTTYTTTVLKIDENGNIKDEIEVTGLTESWFDDIVYSVESDDYFYFFNQNDNQTILKTTKDFSEYEEITYSDATTSEKSILSIYFNAFSNGTFLTLYNDGYVVYNYEQTSSGESVVISYYDSSNSKVWDSETYTVDTTDRTSNYEVTGIQYKNYLLVSSTTTDSDGNLYSFIKVFNSSGTELEENSLSSYYTDVDDFKFYNINHLIEGEDGFFATGYYMFNSDYNEAEYPDVVIPEEGEAAIEPGEGTGPGDIADPTQMTALGAKQIALMYFKDFTITTKTDGNGTITATAITSVSGEVIQFTVTPNEGYQLKLVTVTTSDGETVTFTDYTFTMPSADVTIYAEFELITNPNTGISIPYITIGTGIVIGIGLFLIIRKKKYLK